jgi:hypothetical protein
VFHGAWQADPGSGEGWCVAWQQPLPGGDQQWQDDAGALGDVEVDAFDGERAGCEVGDCDCGVGGAYVGGQHPAEVGVEREPARWPASGRHVIPDVDHKPGLDQRVEVGPHRRTGQTRLGHELSPGALLAACEQGQQRTRRVGVRGPLMLLHDRHCDLEDT